MHQEKCEWCTKGMVPIAGTNRVKRCPVCKGTGRIEQEEEEVANEIEE